MSVPRGRYKRRLWYGVQAPRTQAASENASRADPYIRYTRKEVQAKQHRKKRPARMGKDDTRGRGYRPHTLKQRQIVTLNERPERSVQTTLTEGGTGPAQSRSG